MAKVEIENEKQRLFDALTYEPETGILRWAIDSSRKIKAGEIAGSVNDKGYGQVGLNGKMYKQHRVAWLLYYGDWPERSITHKNGIKTDNRICNLHHLKDFDRREMARRAGKKRWQIPYKNEVLGWIDAL